MNKFIFLFLFPLFIKDEYDCFSQTNNKAVAIETLRVVKNSAFVLGEKLLFDINYGFVTSGYATMEIPAIETFEEQQCYKISVRVRSTPTFDFFYTVRDTYSTFVDVRGIFPLKFEQHIREGNYRRDFIAEFDQLNHFAKTIINSQTKKFDIPSYVHDIVSAFYYTRTLDFSLLKENDILQLYNFYKDTTYQLDVRYLGKEEIEVEAGEFRCVKLVPEIQEGGLFKNSGAMTIWLTDDENKIPVKMSSKIIIGSVVAELREYEGIKNNMKAKLK